MRNLSTSRPCGRRSPRLPRVLHTLAALVGAAFGAGALAARPAAAQGGTPTVAGQVVDSTSGRPVAGVVAVLLDSTWRWAAAARAGEDGTFYLAAPHGGRFQVVLSPGAGAVRVATTERVEGDTMVAHRYVVTDTIVDRTAWLASEVDDTVRFLPRSSGPRAPEALVRRGGAGAASALFVVDATGRVERSTVVMLTATEEAVGAALREWLRLARFRPAMRAGAPVRQWRLLGIDVGPDGMPTRAELSVRYYSTIEVRHIGP